MQSLRPEDQKAGLVSRLAPGILVAATGVGAGDLLTASLAGHEVGLMILWAAVAGALLKWFLNEGIARWQMATETTLLEGWVDRLGRWIRWVFLVYLLNWSVFTAGALINACGVAGTAIWRLGGSATGSKVIWGIVHSLIGLVLVMRGGYALFARVMSVCIGVMFVTVIATALCSGPDWSAVWQGLTVPTIPKAGVSRVLGVLGGVGGTVTLLSYGYWIREERRRGAGGLRACRIDLAVGYTMTAVFGVAMILIGSRLELRQVPGGLAMIALDLANQLGRVVGTWGKWTFLLGFWGAVFSSLLGVWQSVPYLFADFWALRKNQSTTRERGVPQSPERERRGRLSADVAQDASTRTDPVADEEHDPHDADRSNTVIAADLSDTRAYRVYLWAIGLIPLPLLYLSVAQAQWIYAVLGSLFMPLLALTLLIMNNNHRWVGERFRNGIVTNLVLLATLVFFGFLAVRKFADYLD